MSTGKKVVATFLARFQFAIQTSGLSPGQFVRLMGWPREWLGDEHRIHRDIIRVAAVLRLDARWLATGRRTATAEKTIEDLRRVWRGPGDELQKVCSLIELFPSSFEGFGICRYCKRIEQPWADEDQTICKACVKLDELEGL